MRSTNFEFLRATQPKLADDAAAIESLIHERPAQAINLMRSFAEHLLHAFVIARGREGVLTTGDQGKRTIEFDQLLHECESKSSKWLLSAEQLRLFRQIKSEGNKAVHDAEYQATSPMKLLEATHTLAALIAKSLKWAAQSSAFREPPHGGEEAAYLRRQRDEAKRESMQQPVPLDHWIRRDPLPSAPKGKFVGRESLFREINDFVAANTQRVLLIEGQPGRGKSALLAHFIAEQLPTGIVPIYFFFEDGRDSIQTRGWIRHFYASTLAKAGLTECDRGIEQVDPEALVRRLAVRLHEAAEARPDLRLLLIIDAIDEAGTAKDHAIALLGETLPQTVQILAAARPNHVKPNDLARTDARVLDLEQADQVNQHRNDGREYLRQQVRYGGLSLSESQLDEIGKLGDGNFLVLREICRDLPKDESQFDAYLRNLADLRGKGIPLREELERRAWDRLQRLGADELHHIQQTLGLLAISQERLPERVIKSVLKLRKADFQKVMQQAGEYIATATIQDADTTNSKDDADEDPEGLQVHRLYHATFAELVRRELKDELPEIQRLLCESCREWWQSAKPSFEQAYSLRHLVEHLQEVKDWPGLAAVLTDLQFIQARFEVGQGHDLLAEYDTVLKAHPEQDEEFKQRIKQDAALHKYVQDIVEYSRRCTEIRNRHERGECDDPIAEMEQLNFPEPPETTQTIRDMRRTEERQKNPAAHKPAKPTGFSRIRDFQQFVASRLQLLIEVPHATIDIARNYAADGFVAEMAHKFDSTRNKELRLIQGILPSAPPTHSLVIRSITGLRVYEYGSDARDAWMTPDARVALTAGYHTRVIIDLTTGRDITPKIDGQPFALSLDGRFALLQVNSEDNQAQVCLFDLNIGKAICEHADTSSPSHFDIGKYSITPDGSLVVGLSDNELFCWDIIKNKTKSIWLEGARPQHLLLCHSGAIVAVRVTIKDQSTTDLLSADSHDSLSIDRLESLSGRTKTVEYKWHFFDLLKRIMIDEVGDDDLWPYIWSQPFASDFLSAFVTRYGIETADSELIISNDASERAWPRQVNERKTGTPTRLIQDRKQDYLASISADGRYALASDREGIQVLSLDFGISVPMAQRIDDMIVPEVQETPQTCAVDKLDIYRNSELDISVRISPLIPKEPNLDDQDWMAKRSKCSQLLEASGMNLILGMSHQWHLPIAGTDNNESLKMTPDGSILLQLSPSTTITYLDSGNHMAIECLGEARGLTADARAVIFAMKSNSDDWTADLSHFAFWMLNSADWNSTIRRVDNDWHDTHMPPSTCSSRCSPDGRMLIGTTYTHTRLMALNYEWVDDLKRPDADEGGCYKVWRAFSRDGKFLIEYFDGCAYLWRVQNGKTASCVAVDSWQHKDVPTGDTLWIDCDGVLRDTTGRRLCLEIRDPHRGPAWVTGSRLFRIGFDNGDVVQPTGSKPLPWIGKPIPGTFDNNVTYCCQRCRHRSRLPDSVVLTVDSIHQYAGINADSAPVLELPDEAWDDEPGLDFECPHCHQPHRSTPFYVDRRASS